eukprot:5252811-Pyramimonas_sp.AAC.1
MINFSQGRCDPACRRARGERGTFALRWMRPEQTARGGARPLYHLMVEAWNEGDDYCEDMLTEANY